MLQRVSSMLQVASCQSRTSKEKNEQGEERAGEERAGEERAGLLVYVAKVLHEPGADGQGALGSHDLVQASDHVDVLRPPGPGVGAGVPAVAKVDDQEGRDADVGGQEVRGVEALREERVEAVDEDEQDEADDADAGAPGLEARPVRELDALDLDGLGEAEVDDAAARPADEGGRVGEADEPVEDARAAAADGQVGQRQEERARRQRHVRQAVAVARPEDVRGVPGDGERVERARGHVQVRVARAPRGREDDGVDYPRQHRDACVLDAEDERRRARARAPVGQRRLVGRAGDADGERAQDVEEGQAVEEAARRPRDVVPRRLHLARRLDDQLGREEEGEGAQDDTLEKGDKPPRVPLDDVLVRRPRMRPVVEAQPLVRRAAAPEQDEGQDDEPQHHDHLQARKPELGLAVPADRQQVEGDDHDEEDRDPDRNVDRVVPVAHDQRGGHDLVRHQDAQRVPVQVAEREAQAARHIPEAVVAHRAAVDGQVGAHLRDRGDDQVDEHPDEQVRRHQERRPADGQRLA
ncbi:putative 3-hydroxyacyl-CoA dehydrogenase [Microsporum audouinii]